MRKYSMPDEYLFKEYAGIACIFVGFVVFFYIRRKFYEAFLYSISFFIKDL